MELRLFTPDQANALVPYLRAKTKRMRALKRELDATLRRLEVLEVIAHAGASDDSPDVRSLERTQGRVGHLAREIQEEVEAVQARGCVVKDVELGLVDFYGLRGDRLVFLCWKVDEDEVGHWHTLEGGYATRQPLESYEA